MATEGDRERGVRRVKPDAGELEQTLGRARDPTVRHDGPREVMQCLGPTNEAEFGVMSFWDSLVSVKAFAGEDIDVARYFPDDERFLLELTPRLKHFEVARER